MKIAVLSGKGGTGKTLLSVNLAAAAKEAVYIDCDVEEPNGHLFFQPKDIESENISIKIPLADEMLCNGCRKCVDFCKFNALVYINHKLIVFDDVCHSCGGCVLFCPEKALSEKEKIIGAVQRGISDKVKVITGILNTGEASGIPIIKKILDETLSSKEFTFIDCPPGSACIVMESIKDADYCILVAEPTLFGVHNLNMIYELIRLFGKPHGVVLNKCLEGENPAEKFCIEKGIKILGKIPFDNELGTLNSNALISVRENKKYREMFSFLLQFVIEECSMQHLLILSGKGGTGKTTIASAFIKLANAKAYADCDVDAPNLHLVMNQSHQPQRTNYYGMPKAEINVDLCISCDLCRQNCRFNAINIDAEYNVDYYSCEGCGVCAAICPVAAVSLKPLIAGELMLYANRAVFSTAQLKMGSGTSGMLVTEVKKQLKTAAEDVELAIIDGSPGIGCPVIASLSGVDMVLIVAEPSISGISDMERIIKTAEKFQTKIAVCINKYDTNLANTERIESFCKKLQLPLAGRIPFDSEAVKAINNSRSIIDVDCPSGQAARDVFDKTVKILFKPIDRSES